MDRDGKLSESELTSAIRHMQAIQEENTPLDTPPGTPPLSNTISNGTVNGVMPSAGAESSGPELDQVDGDVIANLDAADEKEEEDDEEEEEDEEEEDVDELDSSGVCEDTATILAQYGRLNVGCCFFMWTNISEVYDSVLVNTGWLVCWVVCCEISDMKYPQRISSRKT